METIVLTLALTLLPNNYTQPKVTKRGFTHTVTNNLNYKAEVWVTCGDDYQPEHFTLKAFEKRHFTVVPDKGQMCYVYDFWVSGLK